MEATIDLYECITDELIRKDSRDRKRPLVYVVQIASNIKYFTSDTNAHKYLMSMGYVMNDDCKTYSLKYKSKEELYLARHYKKC